jgi:exodeoxyribonuclease V gamma subunit
MALARRLLPPLLEGADPAQVRRLACAGTDMPDGALGTRQLDHEITSMTRFAQRVRDAAGDACVAPQQCTIAIDLDGEPWQLHAGFADLRPSGLLRWRYDTLRAGDYLEAWMHHLVLCAARPEGVAARTRWLGADDALLLDRPQDPAALLADLLRIYRRGLREPVRFFPRSAWAYVDGGESLSKAHQVWQVTRDRPFGEGADAACRLALRGRADVLNGEFMELAVAVFGPLRDHIVKEA